MIVEKPATVHWTSDNPARKPGKRVRAYVYFCGTCQRNEVVYKIAFHTDQSIADSMARTNGWTCKARDGWICPECARLSVTTHTHARGGAGARPQARPGEVMTMMNEQDQQPPQTQQQAWLAYCLAGEAYARAFQQALHRAAQQASTHPALDAHHDCEQEWEQVQQAHRAYMQTRRQPPIGNGPQPQPQQEEGQEEDQQNGGQ